jgi:hypothetical protein
MPTAIIPWRVKRGTIAILLALGLGAGAAAVAAASHAPPPQKPAAATYFHD